MRLFLFLCCCWPVWGLAQDSSFQDSVLHFRQDWWQYMLEDPRAPLDSADFVHLDWFTPDPSFRVKATFVPIEGASILDIPTYSGITKRFRPFGRLLFSLHGKNMELIAYQSFVNPAMAALDDHLFLPFKDHSSGEETYGGGRYIDLSRKETGQGEFILDFNKAYNPWCAYSAGYNCPIPPKENFLDIRITAGERNYMGPYKERD